MIRIVRHVLLLGVVALLVLPGRVGTTANRSLKKSFNRVSTGENTGWKPVLRFPQAP